MADLSELGKIAAELIDQLELDYERDDVQVGVVALVVEITDSDGDWTAIQYRCSDPRRWIQLGLFETARRSVIQSSKDIDDDDD